MQTERLALRRFRSGDLADLHAMRSDADLIRYIPWTAGSREDARQWLEQRMVGGRLEREGDYATWAVARRTDGRLVGSVNAWYRSVEHQHAEIGFVVARAAQGVGYATEAVTALVDGLFSRLALHRVTGRADTRNTASARLMERLGMRREALHVEDELFKGSWTDTVVYAVLAREWAELRAGHAP